MCYLYARIGSLFIFVELQVMMSNEIASDLLSRAKEQLASGDFEKAANSARGVLALDAENVEATDILKAGTAAQQGQNVNPSMNTENHKPSVPGTGIIATVFDYLWTMFKFYLIFFGVILGLAIALYIIFTLTT